MYALMVIGLMFVLPGLSVLMALQSGTAFLSAIATWFVFWVVGVRLLLAGLRQTLRPGDTLHGIFGVDEAEGAPGVEAGRKLVAEVGMGNLALGTTGVLTLAFSDWRIPVALAGTIFYGLAGFGHWRAGASGGNERVALWSNLWAAGVLAFILLAAALFGLTSGAPVAEAA